MTDKLELKSSHEVVYTVDVADVDSIYHCKPTDPDILTVLMKDGRRLYCDEVCPIDSLQEEPLSEDLEEASKNYALNNTPWDDCINEMQESFKAGAKWKEKQLMAKAKSGTVQKDNQVILDDGTYMDLDPSMQLKPSFVGLKEGDRIKVIVIKED